MASDLIQVPAEVVDIRPKADRSWKLSFNTRELTGEEVSVLADNFQGEGWLVFKPNADILPNEIPEGKADSGTKSQSVRLRDVIFIMWKQRGGKGDYETFYRVTLEKLIEHIKEQLED